MDATSKGGAKRAIASSTTPTPHSLPALLPGIIIGDAFSPALEGTMTADEITARLSRLSSSAGAHAKWVAGNIVPANFMGIAIKGGVSSAILQPLNAVETALAAVGTASSLGIQSVSGFENPKPNGDPNGYHTWGLAVDVNYVTNPYIMHEGGEAALDIQLRPVFNRIARLMLAHDSVIPDLGRGATNAKQVYAALKAENLAMLDYFALMQDGPALVQKLNTVEGLLGYKAAFASGKTPGAPDMPDAAFVQRQMQQDWTVLTSRNPVPKIVAAPASSLVPHPTVFSSAPPVPAAMDRPFDGPASKGSPLLAGRSPLFGYMNLSWDLVNAFVTRGWVWGAIGFGVQSGDIMHFDARAMAALRFKDQATVGSLRLLVGV